MKLCMVGGLRCVVIRVKCDPNRLRSYGAVGGGVENGPFLLRWPVAYTTACTTVQAVIEDRQYGNCGPGGALFSGLSAVCKCLGSVFCIADHATSTIQPSFT